MAENAMYIQWRLAATVLLDSLLLNSWMQLVLHHASDRPPSGSSKKRRRPLRGSGTARTTWNLNEHTRLACTPWPKNPQGNATAVLLGHTTPTGIGPERRYGFQLMMVGDEQGLLSMSDIIWCHMLSILLSSLYKCHGFWLVYITLVIVSAQCIWPAGQPSLPPYICMYVCPSQTMMSPF